MKKKKVKKETLEEFIARGGKIQKLEPFLPKIEDQSPPTIISNKSGVISIISMEDAELFYSQVKKRKPRKKKSKPLNVEHLPEAVRNKFFKHE